MTSVAEWFDARVDVSRTTLGLFVGDLAAITVFVLLGEVEHGISLVSSVGYIVTNTWGPFVVGWLLVSIPFGMYGAAPRESPRKVAVRTVGTWFCADLIGQVIRSLPFLEGWIGWQALLLFGLVSFTVGSTLLCLWRVGSTLLMSRRRSAAPV